MILIRRAGGTLAVLAVAVALSACSSGDGHADTSAAKQSQWLAVARGTVDVEGGMVQVAAHADGVVESVAMTEGDVVEAGQVLATLDPRASKIAVATAKDGVEQAKAQLAELQVALKQARQLARRVAEAAKAGAATGVSADEARDAVASLKAKQAASTTALDVAEQQVASAQLDLDATKLRAPIAGTVVARHVEVGQVVASSPGQPLFELLPDRPHIVRAQVDAYMAGAIRPGMHADVVRDSDSGPVYRATVLWVGQVLQSASFSQDPLARAVANDVDCTLALEPSSGRGTPPAPLSIGQQVLVRVPSNQ